MADFEKMNCPHSSETSPAARPGTDARSSSMLQCVSLWLMRKVFPPEDDEEIGIRHASRQHAAITILPQTIITTDENALVPPRDRLLVFRSLTGIDTIPTVYIAGHAVRAAPNMGVYPRVVRAEQKAARRFKLYNILVNICLSSQMVVGAALTALGASGSSRSSVTAFGALNTITAGFMTYLKGSGLPQKIKDIQAAFRSVREHIEQREREFCLADCTLDPVAEAAAVTKMYQIVKQELEGGKSPAGQPPCTCDKSEAGKITSAIEQMEQRLTQLTQPSVGAKAPDSEKV